MDEISCMIVIPYYTNKLSKFELYSLRRALQIFKDHPICFISPEELEIIEEYAHIPVEKFDNLFFKSVSGYNNLMLSPFFYRRFLDYKYILIYQLDALVFSDDIKYWCSLDYDYYGAPWNDKKWKFKYFNLFGLLNERVGNGGFSLRKTETYYDMARKIKPIKKFIKFGEDIFWCNYGRFFYWKFKIIDYNLALRFAFEAKPEELFVANRNQLPFGCHAFEKNNLAFWNSMIVDLPTS